MSFFCMVLRADSAADEFVTCCNSTFRVCLVSDAHIADQDLAQAGTHSTSETTCVVTAIARAGKPEKYIHRTCEPSNVSVL